MIKGIRKWGIINSVLLQEHFYVQTQTLSYIQQFQFTDIFFLWYLYIKSSLIAF